MTLITLAAATCSQATPRGIDALRPCSRIKTNRHTALIENPSARNVKTPISSSAIFMIGQLSPQAKAKRTSRSLALAASSDPCCKATNAPHRGSAPYVGLSEPTGSRARREGRIGRRAIERQSSIRNDMDWARGCPAIAAIELQPGASACVGGIVNVARVDACQDRCFAPRRAAPDDVSGLRACARGLCRSLRDRRRPGRGGARGQSDAPGRDHPQAGEWRARQALVRAGTGIQDERRAREAHAAGRRPLLARVGRTQRLASRRRRDGATGRRLAPACDQRRATCWSTSTASTRPSRRRRSMRRSSRDGIRFRGETMVFSWPSKAKLLDYGYDRESAMWSRDALEQVLAGVIASPASARIHIVAHSIGTMLTMEALRQIYARHAAAAVERVGAIVFAAPDIDMDVFSSSVERIGPLAAKITVVTATNDRALAVSGWIAGGITRVGAAEQARAQAAGIARDRRLAAGLGHHQPRSVSVECQDSRGDTARHRRAPGGWGVRFTDDTQPARCEKTNTAARNPRPVPHVVMEVASIEYPPKERERLPGLRRSTSPEPFHSMPFHSALSSSSSHLARTTCVARLTDRARTAFHAAWLSV